MNEENRRAVRPKWKGPKKKKKKDCKRKNMVRERPSACSTRNSQVPKKYGNTT
jgi:hypothetical protein